MVLHHKWSSAYRYLANSGFIRIPCERTPCDYQNFEQPVSGVHKAFLLESSQEHGVEDVAILIDEMKVKSCLVINPNTGSLSGYIDTLSTDQLLADCEISAKCL
jgi:hypothetical protein